MSIRSYDRRPPKIYSLDEASEYLRLTRRAVAKIAKRHGLCMVFNRTITFTETDLVAIMDVLRAPPAAGLRPAQFREIPQAEISRRALEFAMSGKRKSQLAKKDRK